MMPSHYDLLSCVPFAYKKINTNNSTLTPGRYTFQIKAVNEDGVESTKIKKAPLVMDAPF